MCSPPSNHATHKVIYQSPKKFLRSHIRNQFGDRLSKHKTAENLESSPSLSIKKILYTPEKNEGITLLYNRLGPSDRNLGLFKKNVKDEHYCKACKIEK